MEEDRRNGARKEERKRKSALPNEGKKEREVTANNEEDAPNAK
jgi:hypothetical protein